MYYLKIFYCSYLQPKYKQYFSETPNLIILWSLINQEHTQFTKLNFRLFLCLNCDVYNTTTSYKFKTLWNNKLSITNSKYYKTNSSGKISPGPFPYPMLSGTRPGNSMIPSKLSYPKEITMNSNGSETHQIPTSFPTSIASWKPAQEIHSWWLSSNIHFIKFVSIVWISPNKEILSNSLTFFKIKVILTYI